MINRKFSTSMACLMLIFSVSLNAREIQKRERLVFTAIKISGENSPDSLLNEASMIIKKNLKGEDYFIINDLYNTEAKITFAGCIKKQCIAELPNAVSEGIVIIISIKTDTVKTGERQLSRYVIEDITENRYTIYVSTAELLKESYDLEFTGTFTERSKLLNETDLIGKKIREYYLKRKPEIKKEEIKENVSSAYYDISGVSFSLSRIKPAGSFNGIADDGFGGNIELNGVLQLFPVLSVNPGLSFYSLNPSNSNINSAYMLLPEITFGYNFIIDEDLTLTPLIGAGYSLMSVDGTTDDDLEDGGSNFYYNPVLKAGVEGVYFLADEYSLICSISYNCIVENDSVLYFRSFNLGIRVSL